METNQNQKFAIFSFIPIRTVFEMEDEYSWEPHTTLANGSSDRTTLPQFTLWFQEEVTPEYSTPLKGWYLTELNSPLPYPFFS